MADTSEKGVVRVESLAKHYGPKVAVQNVSLQLKAGEIVGLLGPNGAGKTTTFYMVVGLIPATAGKVFLDGRDITEMPMWQRAKSGLGYLPQEASIFRKLSVWDNVMAVVETLDLPGREAQARTAQQLADLGLERLARQPAFTLSGGERRRLEIIEAAERLYAGRGWDGLTMDQLAREARLSRALLYVYFKDRAELHLAIVARAFELLKQRFREAGTRTTLGLDKVQAIGRAYVAFAHEFPHYFDACARFEAAQHQTGGSAALLECTAAADAAIAEVVAALEAGRVDGSIRPDAGASMLTASALWGFTHGIIQLMTTKGAGLLRHGVTQDQLADHSLQLLRHSLRGPKAS